MIQASIVTGTVTDSNASYYFIQASGMTYALSKAEGRYAIGDIVTVTSYEDKRHKRRLTTKPLVITTTTYGWAEVTQVRRDLGVFVDVGLPDKDVVVSLDEMPKMPNLWPKKGDKLYVRLKIDHKGRLWGVLADREVFQKLAGPAYNNMQNQKLRAIVYHLKLTGTFVYLPDNHMLGFIHPSERYQEPRLGQELEARVIGYRAIDRTLNLSAKPRSFEMLDQDAQMILTYLERQGGFMTLNDTSDPEAIKAIFGISKGQFKKALGRLMKAGKVRQDRLGTEVIAS